MSGTSMAAPHVSGAVALLKAFAPTMDAQALRNSVLNDGTPLASMSGLVQSGKLLSVDGMLSSAALLPPPATGQPSPTPSPPAPTPTATPSPPTPTPSPTPQPSPGYFQV